MGKIVEKGKIQGLIDPDLDTHTAAYTLIAFHDGILLQWQRSRDLLEGPVFVKTFRHLLFKDLGVKGGGSPVVLRASRGRRHEGGEQNA